MSETTEFTIGAEVSCEDGVCGELRRVVVNPIKRAITHLVVEPRHRHNMGHLVPIDLVETTTPTVASLQTNKRRHGEESPAQLEGLHRRAPPAGGRRQLVVGLRADARISVFAAVSSSSRNIGRNGSWPPHLTRSASAQFAGASQAELLCPDEDTWQS